jgi:hypothetical protein
MDPARKGQPLDEDDDFKEFALEDWGRQHQMLDDSRYWDRSWLTKVPTNEDDVMRHIREAGQKLKTAQGQQR